ncbi:MAG: SurA N-terminal domain-containing protein [Candidatus Aminicenantes bacterium]|nr:MAG: SurA N-terminal domain-containing protein [Candidatus Aminicenantes bacterium]
MLKAMRKNVKQLSPILWIVIGAFIITIFAVWGGGVRSGEGGPADTLISIGKEKISAQFYIESLRQRLEAMQREFKELNRNLIQQLNIPQQILQQIIQQSLLLQTAQNMNISASAGEVREKIISYPVFQRDGKFIGFQEYKRILTWNRISIAEFEESLRKEIIIDKLIKSLTAGIAITQEELWENYKNENETARLEYVVVEADKIEFKETPPDSETREYFEKNKENYQIPEKREGLLVFLNMEDIKGEIELADSEIEKYYEDNISQFKEPEKMRISRIYLPYEDKEKEMVRAEAQNMLDKINAGEDFGDLAIKNSKDEKAQESGDWGLYDWRRLSPEEQEKIKELSKGDISEILELPEGVSIIKMTEKEPEITKSLEEVRQRIKSILEDQKSRQIAEDRISRLEKRARKEKSLEAAAQKTGFEVKTTGLLKEKEAFEDIDTSGSISQTLFALEEKEISSLINTFKGIGIAQLEKIDPPRQANLEEVKNDVEEDFTAVKKKEKALEKIKKIKAEVKSKSLEELAEKYNAEYKTVNEHKRGQYLGIIAENKEVDKLAFSLSLKEVSEPVEFENGYSLVRTLDRKEVTKEDFEKDKEKERENLLEVKRNKFFQSYMLKLREEREVKIKYDLFLKINSDILSRFEGED